MVRRIRAIVDQRARRMGAALLEVGDDHDAGGAHLALDVAVLIEAPVDEILVVGDGGVEADGETAHPTHLCPGVVIDVLPQHRIVFLVDADRVGDRVRLAFAVVQHGIEVPDLTEAVAAELERGGHEAQAPLADVECGAPIVILGVVTIRNDHLRERHSVRDGSHVPVVVVGDRVQRHALAVVEPHAQRPVLPRQLVAVQLERRAVRLGDLERLQRRTAAGVADALRNMAGHVLAHDLRPLDAVGVLDFEQFHRVGVDDAVEAAHRPRVRIGTLCGFDPRVGPAQASTLVLLGRHRLAVRPGVHEHQIEIGDPAIGKRGNHIGVCTQRRVGLFPLVDGEVGLHVRDVGPGFGAPVVQ
ncbi:unannotated protein [freshwater metagenome]|uniref:Unannotated protein n=1 Tax=freshwater metagenome TaxID=449393 RepID=A0A6J7FAH8_9ZZZZ